MGPQAGTSDSPPLARVMGVGRQQQQGDISIIMHGVHFVVAHSSEALGKFGGLLEGFQWSPTG